MSQGSGKDGRINKSELHRLKLILHGPGGSYKADKWSVALFRKISRSLSLARPKKVAFTTPSPAVPNIDPDRSKRLALLDLR